MIKIIFGVILAILLLLPGCSYTEESETTYQKQDYNYALEIDLGSFMASDPNINTGKTFKNVKGIIAPHHLLAEEIIHEVFRAVNGEDIEYVIILGPDHKSEKGLQTSISDNDWQTPFGILPINKEINRSLVEFPNVKVDNSLMVNEHSNATLIPFIKYYFPEVSINTITLPATLNLDEVQAFADLLYNIISDDKTLLIASVDFSHYLTREEAFFNDEITLEAINKRDYERIMRLDSGYLDSPQTLIAFLIYMEKAACENFDLLNHTNSYDIISVENQGTTSYFTFVFN